MKAIYATSFFSLMFLFSCQKEEYSSDDDGYYGSSGSFMHSGCIHGYIRDSVTLDTLPNYKILVNSPYTMMNYGSGEYKVNYVWGPSHYQYFYQPTHADIKIYDSTYTNFIKTVAFPITLIEDSAVEYDIFI